MVRRSDMADYINRRLTMREAYRSAPKGEKVLIVSFILTFLVTTITFYIVGAIAVLNKILEVVPGTTEAPLFMQFWALLILTELSMILICYVSKLIAWVLVQVSKFILKFANQEKG